MVEQKGGGLIVSIGDSSCSAIIHGAVPKTVTTKPSLFESLDAPPADSTEVSTPKVMGGESSQPTIWSTMEDEEMR